MNGTKQWKVEWFPSDVPQASKVYASEASAEQKFEDEKSAGTAPILLSRTLPDWEVERNSLLESEREVASGDPEQ